MEYNYAYFPILIDEKKFGMSRDEIYERLKQENVFARRYFWPIVADFGCYEEMYKDCLLPVARKAGQQVLCLPIYNGLKKSVISHLVKLLFKI